MSRHFNDQLLPWKTVSQVQGQVCFPLCPQYSVVVIECHLQRSALHSKDLSIALLHASCWLPFLAEYMILQLSSVAQSRPALCQPMNSSLLSIPNSRSSLRLTSIESVMPSSHLILGRPLLLLPPIPPSIRVFSNESTFCMRWPKYWSFSFSVIPSKEIPGLISFRKDWLDLLAVQGAL